MKRTILIFAALLLCGSAFAQQEPNYELAARFSQKQIAAMVFSTSVTPNWFRDSDRFWYSWQTPEGTSYYLVDPATGQKKPLFNMERLAMEVTLATKDPFDAQHLPSKTWSSRTTRSSASTSRASSPSRTASIILSMRSLPGD